MSGRRLDLDKLEQTMRDADIQAVSIASGSSKDAIETTQRQILADGSAAEFSPEISFGAASLSKPVFAYLVLKLASADTFSLDKTKLNEIVSFKDFCRQNDILWSATPENIKRIELLTPAMALSHMTGLPIGYNKSKGEIKFDFDPGQGFAYSGLGLMYLQACVEKQFDASLESLAKKYVFDPSGMTNSSYYPRYDFGHRSDRDRKRGKIYLEATTAGLWYQVIGSDGNLEKGTISWGKLPANFPKNVQEIILNKAVYLCPVLDHISAAGYISKANAANSLQTTGRDYIQFCLDWMNNNNKQPQAAFDTKVPMTKDPWAVRENVLTETLEHLGCGYGWMLEKDDEGRTFAFHTGDMNQWRAGVKLDVDNKAASVFFSKSKSENGHLLQEQVFGKSRGLDYFFQKFHFARDVSELKSDWREKSSWGLRKEAEEQVSDNDQSLKITDNARPAQMYNKHRTSAVSVRQSNDRRSNVKLVDQLGTAEKQHDLQNQSDKKEETTKSTAPTPYSTRPVPPWEKK